MGREKTKIQKTAELTIRSNRKKIENKKIDFY